MLDEYQELLTVVEEIKDILRPKEELTNQAQLIKLIRTITYFGKESWLENVIQHSLPEGINKFGNVNQIKIKTETETEKEKE